MAQRQSLEDTAFPRSLRPSFNGATLGKSIENRYVAWLDLMGAKNIMGRSLGNAATYIGKIHVCALEAADGKQAEVYPVIDGCYVLTDERTVLESVLRTAMQRLAAVFVHEKEPTRRFLVRGGIAAGRVIPGRSIAACSTRLSAAPQYSGCLAIGTAIGQGYAAESKAPPFGFWVDITARAFRGETEHPFTTTYWRWWAKTTPGPQQRDTLGAELMKYFDWAEQNQRSLEYDPIRLAEHRSAAREYFVVNANHPD